MRIRHAARLGGILAGALGMLASFVPTASAQGVVTIDFQGDATLTAGLGIPGVHGTPAINLNPGATKKTPPFTVKGGNTRNGVFGSTLCVANGTNVNKPGKPPAWTLAPCGITATYTVSGFCGLSSGTGTGTATIAGTWRIWFNFTWTDPGGGNLVILGNYWKTGPTKPTNPALLEGDIEAFVKATPDPTPIPNNTTCTNKTQTRFVIAGQATLTHPKRLP